MSTNNLVFKEKKRKLSDMEENSGNHSKKNNVDTKLNIDMICKNIKKEPDFIVREIKKEPDFVIREIKKEPDFVIREIKREPDFMIKEIKREPCQSDLELVEPQFTELPPKSKGKKQKTKTNKIARKALAKAKRRTLKKQKKSTQAKKTKSKRNGISKKSKQCTAKTKTKRKKKKKSKSASNSARSIKKEANTLLDQQGNGDLHLFGFKDELEYFSSESDHKEFEETSFEKNIAGKRTSLSRLNARDKVICAFKSASTHPSSNPKPLILQAKGENVDLLGSILENQALWHSKTSHMKVNEDGSVEVIDRKNKLKEIESISGKEINLLKNKTNSAASTQARNGHLESLNLKENLGTYPTKVNIKIEACDTIEIWDTEKVVSENKEQIWEEKIKVEGKKGNEPSSSLLKTTFANSPKIEKFDDEVDDCPIFSTYSKTSKGFSLKRDKERQMRFLSDESEIQIIEIKKTEKIEGNEIFSKKHKSDTEEKKYKELDPAKKRARSPSPKRKEENKQRKNITCIIVE